MQDRYQVTIHAYHKGGGSRQGGRCAFWSGLRRAARLQGAGQLGQASRAFPGGTRLRICGRQGMRRSWYQGTALNGGTRGWGCLCWGLVQLAGG
jgi:hypothetical protein